MNSAVGRVRDAVALILAVIAIIYAASGPLNDFVQWVIEATTPGWEEMSRKDQRLLARSHWLGEAHRVFQQDFLRPTGLIIGLPILLSFVVSALSLEAPRWARWLLAGISAAVFSIWIAKIFAMDGGQLPSVAAIDYLAFPLAVLVTLYLTFRMFGSFIVGFCLFWLIYFFIRGYLPEWTGILAGSEASVAQNLRQMVLGFWAQTGGMFGQPVQVVTGNVLVFIVFGAIIMACGAGDLLMKIANRLTGGVTGGAAHAAIASSALFGMLSGAAISNVVSTGAMTIPVIKKSGFRPAFAGAVEAAASTGGQIMPPVMGVVAFFVAGQIGIEYRYVVVAAIIPALFYYMGTFLAVYFEARRYGIGALTPAERPALTRQDAVNSLVFIIPIATLSYFLFTQPSVPKAGFFGIVAALGSALVLFPAFRGWAQVRSALIGSGRMCAGIIVIVVAIGLIVGLIQSSGFAGRLSLLLAQIANGPLFLVLIVVALGAIVLGMGLPPGATYFIIVVALSSGIDTVGIAPLTLHLFVVVFAMMSTVTPPVALAAFAAAPIAGANPVQTGFHAAKIALAGFLIPFVFVYHPAVLYKMQALFAWFGGEKPESRAMIDIDTVSWFDLGWIVAAFALAMWLIASALAGFDRAKLAPLARLLRGGTGLVVLAPQLWIAGPAVLIGLGLIAYERAAAKRAVPAPQ
ncbi:MAG: TRAP transporter permease [Sulfitobacter sp.]